MITFETKVWEGDWERVLRPECIGANLSRCAHPFAERSIMINNVNDPVAVSRKCQELLDNNLIDSYYGVDFYARAALDHFGLKEYDFSGGYRYSIAELVSIYLCKTPYLLHFSSDSMVSEETPPGWVETAIGILETRPEVSVVNLLWNKLRDEARSESFAEDDDCFYGYGFSDQMYLVRTEDFMSRIYLHAHSGTAAHHHGEIFEKRVDAWMRTENRPRATLKAGSYIHPTYGD